MGDMEQLTFLSEEALASLSPLQGAERVLKENPDSCSSTFELFATSCEPRGGASPRYIVWENVPGCLSSNKGRDFGCLLDALEDCGYFVCWRTLDSQFARVLRRESGRQLGPVPQRRRRVFLVGSLGGPSAADILFERTSLRGDHPSSREAREALARDSEGGAGMGDSEGCVTPWDVQSKRVNTPEGTSPTLPSGTGEGMNIQSIVMTTASTNANGSNVNEEGAAYTLDGTNSNAVAFAQNTRDEVRLFGGDGQTVGALSAQPGMKQTSYVCMQDGQANGAIEQQLSTTLNASHEQPIVCAADDNGKTAIEEDLCGSLKVGGGSAVNSNDPYVLSNGDDVIGALCSCDSKWVQNQQVNQGKIICQKRK